MNRDIEAIDFFRDESVVVDPYTYFDQLRGKSPIWREPHQGRVFAEGPLSWIEDHEEVRRIYLGER